MTKQPELDPQQPLSYFDALQILHIVKSTAQCEFVRLRFGDMNLCIERVSGSDCEAGGGQLSSASGSSLAASVTAAPAAAVAAAGAVPEPASSTPATEMQAFSKAPMVGIFYCSSGSGAEPFVQVGDQVRASDTVGIVRAMQLSRPVLAGVDGQVVEVLAADASFVEYGQTIVRILPVA